MVDPNDEIDELNTPAELISARCEKPVPVVGETSTPPEDESPKRRPWSDVRMSAKAMMVSPVLVLVLLLRSAILWAAGSPGRSELDFDLHQVFERDGVDDLFPQEAVRLQLLATEKVRDVEIYHRRLAIECVSDRNAEPLVVLAAIDGDDLVVMLARHDAGIEFHRELVERDDGVKIVDHRRDGQENRIVGFDPIVTDDLGRAPVPLVFPLRRHVTCAVLRRTAQRVADRPRSVIVSPNEPAPALNVIAVDDAPVDTKKMPVAVVSSVIVDADDSEKISLPWPDDGAAIVKLRAVDVADEKIESP